MLPGLLTTTMVTVLMCASVFQRRSRHGFLDELETVRGEALTAPKGEVATAVALADAEMAQDRLDRGEAAHEPDWHGWPGEENTVDNGDEIWAQPSPHPIRPQEMWHPGRPAAKFDTPAGLGDGRLAEPGSDPSTDEVPDGPVDVEETIAADGPSSNDGPRRRFSRFRAAGLSAGADPSVTSDPEIPVIPTSDATGLLGGPVGRRDRSGRERRSLPGAEPLRARRATGDDRSPLVEAPLPPASPPASVLPEAAAVPEAVAAPEPEAALEDATSVSVDGPEAPSVPDPDPVPGVAATHDLVIDDRSELAVGATVIRFGEGSRTSMDHGEHGPVVRLDEGWCWVTTRGDGPQTLVRVQLPNGDLSVAVGGRALAVVENDRTAFVVIAGGSAELGRGDTTLPLTLGSMVLLPASGEPQIDRAEADELTLDPLVGHNLAIDAHH